MTKFSQIKISLHENIIMNIIMNDCEYVVSTLIAYLVPGNLNLKIDYVLLTVLLESIGNL